MKTLAAMIALVVAACGGSPANQRRDDAVFGHGNAAEPEEGKSSVQDAAEPASSDPAMTRKEPSSPPQSTPSPAPIHGRLHDSAGEIPGLPGFSLTHAPDAMRCGGIRITTTRSKRIAVDDQPIAAVYALEFPGGLNFNPEQPEAAKASTKKFTSWLGTLQKTTGHAEVHYQKQLRGGDAKQRASAAARLIQSTLRVASLLARAEIPVDVATGEYAEEKVAAFCDEFAKQADAWVSKAEAGAAACARFATEAGPGWWTAVCTASP